MVPSSSAAAAVGLSAAEYEDALNLEKLFYLANEHNKCGSCGRGGVSHVDVSRFEFLCSQCSAGKSQAKKIGTERITAFQVERLEAKYGEVSGDASSRGDYGVGVSRGRGGALPRRRRAKSSRRREPSTESDDNSGNESPPRRLRSETRSSHRLSRRAERELRGERGFGGEGASWGGVWSADLNCPSSVPAPGAQSSLPGMAALVASPLGLPHSAPHPQQQPHHPFHPQQQPHHHPQQQPHHPQQQPQFVYGGGGALGPHLASHSLSQGPAEAFLAGNANARWSASPPSAAAGPFASLPCGGLGVAGGGVGGSAPFLSHSNALAGAHPSASMASTTPLYHRSSLGSAGLGGFSGLAAGTLPRERPSFPASFPTHSASSLLPAVGNSQHLASPFAVHAGQPSAPASPPPQFLAQQPQPGTSPRSSNPFLNPPQQHPQQPQQRAPCQTGGLHSATNPFSSAPLSFSGNSNGALWSTQSGAGFAGHPAASGLRSTNPFATTARAASTNPFSRGLARQGGSSSGFPADANFSVW